MQRFVCGACSAATASKFVEVARPKVACVVSGSRRIIIGVTNWVMQQEYFLSPVASVASDFRDILTGKKNWELEQILYKYLGHICRLVLHICVNVLGAFFG